MSLYSDCCCVKWGGLKPHIEWVNVPVCYHPSMYRSHVFHAYVLFVTFAYSKAFILKLL